MRIRRAARMLAALGLFAAQTALSTLASAQHHSPKHAPKPAAKPAGKPTAPGKPAAPKPRAPSKPTAPKGAKAQAKHPPAKQAKHAQPKHAQPKHAHAPSKSRRPPPKHARKAGAPGEPDEAARRTVAGPSARVVRESAELKAMRELDRALFPGVAPTAGAPWVAEGTPLVDRGEPEVVATGLPPETKLAAPSNEPVRDLSWLHKLVMPDIPVRWDARVIRYLEYYKNNPRGRSMITTWVRKSGRYGAAIRRTLREQGLPEDIVWLALVESGFDPTIHSPAGAAGLWQFMPHGARVYGLTVDRWIDERMDPERSTVAAARYLADLHTRFGSWELAFAAYNMGYGGLLASIRKYNTNDFWELSRLESGMPLETALYVPKIVAMAIVARNKAIFRVDDVELDPAVSFDKISVLPGVSMQSVAVAAGTSTDKIEDLNPQLLSGRLPPLPPGPKHMPAWAVRVPAGSAPRAAKSLQKLADAEPKTERYTVRWGESLDDIASRRHTTKGTLASLNGLRRDESLRPGTVLLVPVMSAEDAADPFNDVLLDKPIVVVPAVAFAAPDRRRVFYRVTSGDTLRDLAPVLGASVGELCHWNAVDPGATLHEGMTLQAWVPRRRPGADVLVLEERDARVLHVGSKAFFAHFEGLRGRTRVEIVAKKGDTFRKIAARYGLRVAQLERINGRRRSATLRPGDKVVVYVSGDKAALALAAAEKDRSQDRAQEPIAAAHPAIGGDSLADDPVAKDEAAAAAKPKR